MNRSPSPRVDRRRRAPAVPLLALSLAVAPGVVSGRTQEPAHDEQLGRLVARLLEHHPRLEAARSRSRALAEGVAGAGSLPDPQLGYRYFASTPETRVGPQRQMIELTQGLPWKGKRALVSERAASIATSAEWDAEDLRLTLVAELKRTYAELGYLQQALAINAEERELLRRFESIALLRYATGEGIQQSVVKVQTDISRLADRELELLRLRDVSARRLAELIGRPDAVPALGPIDRPLPEMTADPEALEAIAVTRHPRVLAAERRVDAERLGSRRRELDHRPDFRVGVSYTQVDDRDDLAGVVNPPEDNGQDVVALSVGVNLPLWRGRTRAAVAEAQESVRSSARLVEAIRNELRYRVQDAALRWESSAERGRLHAELILPQARESLASAEAAYTTNRQGFLDLLDAERVLFQVRLAYQRLVADCWIAIADIEAAVGDRAAVPAETAGGTAEAGR